MSLKTKLENNGKTSIEDGEPSCDFDLMNSHFYIYLCGYKLSLNKGIICMMSKYKKS